RVERTGDEGLRRDLALAYLGAGRRVEAERHLALLGAEAAAPLQRVIAAEDAARAKPTRATLEPLISAWSAAGRLDRAVTIAEEHGIELEGSDAAARARVDLLEERGDFMGAARALAREWSDPKFPAQVQRIQDLLLAGAVDDAWALCEEQIRLCG